MMALLTTYDPPVSQWATRLCQSILRLYLQDFSSVSGRRRTGKATGKPFQGTKKQKVPHKVTYPSEGAGLVFRELTCWPCSLVLGAFPASTKYTHTHSLRYDREPLDPAK